MKTVQYIRVSTTEQNVDRQVLEGYNSFIDKVSGSVAFSERKDAKKLLEAVEDGNVDEVLVHSIDRLGRNTLDILSTIKFFTSKGVNVIAKKEGLQTMVNGKENPVAKMVVGIMATLAEFELERIKERQLEGIAKAKARGSYKTNGGKPKESIEQFMAKSKNANCVKYLKQGESLRRAAKLSEVSRMLAKELI